MRSADIPPKQRKQWKETKYLDLLCALLLEVYYDVPTPAKKQANMEASESAPSEKDNLQSDQINNKDSPGSEQMEVDSDTSDPNKDASDTRSKEKSDDGQSKEKAKDEASGSGAAFYSGVAQTVNTLFYSVSHRSKSALAK